MPTDLAHHIQETPLVDTHEHLRKEPEWLENGPDILQDLFGNYVPADLNTAGASPEAMKRLIDASDPDIAGRFEGIRAAWEATQFTGYGEAVRLIAKHVYDIDELAGESLTAAQEKIKTLRKPGERYRLLHDVANLDHVQTDDFCWPCLPDHSGLDFFLYDLSWAGFCNGQVDPQQIHAETGVEVKELATLQAGMEAIFAKYAPCAIAVKAQHAYNRTLNWIERSDAEASTALETVLSKPAEEIPVETRLCLGDWCWARGTELSIEHNLPFKIHTGYYAGNDRMPVSRIPAGNMCALFARYLDAKFVLMHIAYPYNDELVALAKHYRNIWVDLCWAWSIDPYSSRDFLRRFLHAVPSNKLFAFGGDTGWPTSSMAYAIQARNEIRRALESEITDGYMNEKQAMQIATRLMRGNQFACFEVGETRANIRAAA
ncbi:MAG: amidohydrolase family protein [Candidatus Poribacteria bacterium]|nr:amidohydrolase family protein [Candidatus Poribacteria bacterium]